MATTLTSYPSCSSMSTSCRWLINDVTNNWASWNTDHPIPPSPAGWRAWFRRLLFQAEDSESNSSAAKVRNESNHWGGHVISTLLHEQSYSGSIKTTQSWCLRVEMKCKWESQIPPTFPPQRRGFQASCAQMTLLPQKQYPLSQNSFV